MGVLGGVFVLKSGLRILIRTPEVPFLVPPKTPKMGVFGYFGGTENGTSGARIKILRPLFNTNDINNHLRSLDLFRSMISRTIDKKFVMITPSPQFIIVHWRLTRINLRPV